VIVNRIIERSPGSSESGILKLYSMTAGIEFSLFSRGMAGVILRQDYFIPQIR
jgi:hypothetical protein